MPIFGGNPFLQDEGSSEDTNIFVDLLQTVVVALSICVVIYLFIATPNEVNGQSMEPTFFHKELLLTNKVVHLFGNTGMKKIVGDYKRGDVVIFRSTYMNEDFIKRIVAVEGDTLMLEDGYVYVNDKKLDEPYLPEGRRTEPGSFITESDPVTVPEDSYLVFGDNRGHSTDSRNSLVGFVKRSQLKGRVFFRYWPLDRFGLIKGHRYENLDSSLNKFNPNIVLTAQVS